MSTLKLAAVFSDKTLASTMADFSQSLMFEACAETTHHLPFAALVLGTSPKLMDPQRQEGQGLYLVSERALLNQPLGELKRDLLPVSVGIFPLVAKAEIGPEAADRHWLEQHAPIALQVHTAITHYYQLTVMHKFSGEDWDGLALCCFANEDDLRNKFYSSAKGKQQVSQDIAKFADTKRSPRRVVARLVSSHAR